MVLRFLCITKRIYTIIKLHRHYYYGGSRRFAHPRHRHIEYFLSEYTFEKNQKREEGKIVCKPVHAD